MGTFVPVSTSNYFLLPTASLLEISFQIQIIGCT